MPWFLDPPCGNRFKLTVNPSNPPCEASKGSQGCKLCAAGFGFVRAGSQAATLTWAGVCPSGWAVMLLSPWDVLPVQTLVCAATSPFPAQFQLHPSCPTPRASFCCRGRSGQSWILLWQQLQPCHAHVPSVPSCPPGHAWHGHPALGTSTHRARPLC